MTVSYQAPVESKSNSRPLTSHLKVSKPADIMGLSQLPPPPIIRDLADVARVQMKSNKFSNRELPKNTGSSLWQETLLMTKPKTRLSKASLNYKMLDKKKATDPRDKGGKLRLFRKEEEGEGGWEWFLLKKFPRICEFISIIYLKFR